MLIHFVKEKDSGRFPTDIEFHLVDLPAEIKADVLMSRKAASDEMTPRTAS